MTEYSIDTRDHQGERIEIGRQPDGAVSVRSGSDGQDGPVLTFTRDEWVAFVAGVKNGEFDPLRPRSTGETVSSDR